MDCWIHGFMDSLAWWTFSSNPIIPFFAFLAFSAVNFLSGSLRMVYFFPDKA
jgi:hypothetical protein